jgi:acetyl esterase
MRTLIRAATIFVAILAVAGFVALYVSPWPGVVLVRYLFDRDSAKTAAALKKHVPPQVVAQSGLRYDPADPDGYLDIYRPPAVAGATLPVIVWVHGGGFVSGRRGDGGNYLKVLAGEGFVTVSVGYSIAPGSIYPTPVKQLNAALGFLARERASLDIDSGRLFLAGDSAGAQISAQFANVVTSNAYAEAVGITPSVKAEQIKGVLLFCGVYDLGMVNMSGPFGLFLKTVVWSYSGSRDGLADPNFARLSVKNYLTAAFPPAFISAGNADPLAPQSVALANALKEQGVQVETLFFPDNYEPKLGHEYQFDLDGDAGRLALSKLSAFVRAIKK